MKARCLCLGVLFLASSSAFAARMDWSGTARNVIEASNVGFYRCSVDSSSGYDFGGYNPALYLEVRHKAGEFRLLARDVMTHLEVRELDLLLFVDEKSGGQTHYVKTAKPQSTTAFRSLSRDVLQFETMLEQPTGRWELVQAAICRRIKGLPDIQTILQEELQRNQKCRPVTDAMAVRRAQNRESFIDDLYLYFDHCTHVIKPIGD